MANSQHRCVFVGNIPYDATEEQLVQICEEVGPVVSFRLVIDRETGKPKGYGFCEYKDEETALSARRNLHGYDINGRQLRVDFAENDKNNDKSREQGRGGPGPSTTTAPQKQIGGPAIQGDPSLHQPIGLQVAMAAAVVMAGTPGGGNITQNGLQSQPILGTDPLTLHLAKIPKNQLIEVLTEVKAMATQNKEQARQLLLAHPQLSKAVLQAHIMLKTVPPHMPSSSVVSAIANNGNKDHNNPQHLIHNPAWGYKVDHHPNVGSRLHDKDQIGHPSKLLKMEDGRGSSYSPACVNLSASVSGSSQAVSLSGNQILKAGAIDSQNPNPELPAGIESALLQQVLTLTPEQLSSLPPEQQQQVIQLQQMLRQST
ncbi:cleavage stimulating factor 64-like isoform X4 [Rutidosis leptorrhynchoides]|uniref:cleavage stimulating factor 64-like isoform X4 n=1 Tax=Rutidosis leptorrhynchoides TaxID=125765 RepID=UPI003A997D1A